MSAGKRHFEIKAPTLTPREREIAGRIGRGEDDKAIAAAMGVTVGSITSRKQRIREKLDLPSTRHIAMYAVEQGLTAPEATSE
jgi:DNA-binding NarL/FixJ family response regulator